MTGRPFRPHPKPAPRASAKGAAPAGGGHRFAPLGQDAAQSIAIEALGWLAGEPERLDRFLALTGMDPGSIRAAARQPGFLSAVLDHVTADESLLAAFATASSATPEQVAAARETLAGPSLWSST